MTRKPKQLRPILEGRKRQKTSTPETAHWYRQDWSEHRRMARGWGYCLDQTGGTHTSSSAQLWESSLGSHGLWDFSTVGLTQLCEGSVPDPEHPLPFHYQPSPTAISIHLNPDVQHSWHCRAWVPPDSSEAARHTELCWTVQQVLLCFLWCGQMHAGDWQPEQLCFRPSTI